MSPFRKTRSGMGFSPWTRNVGTPLHVPHFDFEDALQQALDSARPVRTPAGSPSSSSSPSLPCNSPDDPDDPDVGSATSLPSDCVSAEELAALDRLFKQFARTDDRSSASSGAILSSPCSGSESESRKGMQGTSPIHPLPSSSLGKTKKKFHSDQRSKVLRRKRRAGQGAKDGLLYPDGKLPKPCALRQIQNALALYADWDFTTVFAEDDAHATVHGIDPIQTDWDMDGDDVPVSSTAYTARLLKQTRAECRNITKEEACRLPGFTYVAWTGRVTRPVLDRKKRVVVLLDGRPDDPTWDRTVNGELCTLLPLVAGAYRFAPGRKPNRRGDFETISCGISYGGGQKRVGNFAMCAYNRALWSLLLKLRALRRVANFANTAMQVFFPRVHAQYSRTLAALCAHHPELKRNFDNNAFAAISLNLGPRACAYPHTDHLNLAHGLCAITALGNYNPVTGGHLILWDLRLIIEFPPGATILIPSAILKHSNTALAGEEERRYAFLQYSAGGLFRWVDCGFQSKKSFLAAGNEFELSGKELWQEGIGMYSTWDELRSGSLSV